MPGTDLVQSLLRGLDILQLLAASEAGVRLADLCERLDVKAPTMHNLLRTLKARGFVAQGAGGRYRIGPGALELGRLNSDSKLLVEGEKAVLALGAELPDASVTLVQPVGNELHLVLHTRPEWPGVCKRPKGKVFSAYSSSSGLLLLAMSGDEERAAIMRGEPFDEFGARVWGTRERLDDAMADVRADGYAANPHIAPDRFSVVMAIHDAGGEPVGAFGLGRNLPERGSAQRFKRATIAAVRRHTDAFNEAMADGPVGQGHARRRKAAARSH